MGISFAFVTLVSFPFIYFGRCCEVVCVEACFCSTVKLAPKMLFLFFAGGHISAEDILFYCSSTSKANNKS